MDYFLIDYENTGESGLKGIRELGEDTCTVIFYSENADKISFEMHQTLCCCRTKLEFRKVYTGKKNALDFQLSTYLGFLIATNPENHFFIVSKDNGYRVVMDFWKDKKIRQIDSIGRAHAKPLMIETRKQPQQPSEQAPEVSSGETTQIQTPVSAVSSEPAKQEPEDRSLQQPAEILLQTAFTAMNVPKETAKESPSEVRVMAGEMMDIQKPESGAETPEAEKTSGSKVHDSHNKSEQNCPNLGQSAENADEKTENTDRNTEIKEDKAESPEMPEVKKENPEKRPHRGGRRKKTASQVPPVDEFQPSPELQAAIAQVIEGKEEQDHIGRFIVKYKTKQGVNNAIVKLYGTEKAGELYKKIKPLLKDKKGK
ncbi:MAG: PIN domain-containing protein [Clostridiales bacterium]|nr:PIN domain-containing protein [Clostridiales bacterium]